MTDFLGLVFSGRELPLGLSVLAKATLLFAAGAVAALALHRRSAASRHFVWAIALGGSLVLGVLVPFGPRVDVPVWRTVVWSAAGAPNDSRATKAAPAAIGPRLSSVPATGPRPGESVAATPGSTSRPSTWLMLWLAGSLVVAGWGALGYIGLSRLAGRAVTVDDPGWQWLLTDSANQLGVRRTARLLRSGEIGAPMTWGIVRPVIVLPADADAWAFDRRRAVLLHELSHIARGDSAVQLAALLSCALYWFHPAAWLAARRLRHEGERACDDLVLGCGTAAEDYASHLLAVARGARSLRLTGAVAIGMARRSSLEGRILSVLDDSVRRTALSLRARVGGVAALGMALVPMAALRPVARAQPASPRLAGITVSPAVVVAPSQTQGSCRLDADRNAEREPSMDCVLPASAGGTLTLDLESGGNVEVRGWDEPRVRVHAEVSGTNWRDVRVLSERVEGGVRVHADFDRRLTSTSSRNRFEIRVPRRYDVRLSSSGGSITLIDLEGEFRGHTGGGELTLERLTGSTSLSTGGGEIRVSESNLSGSVRTGGGMVQLSRVSGGLKGSSGSGPVIYMEPSDRRSRDEPTGDLRSIEVDRSGAIIDRNARDREEAGRVEQERRDAGARARDLDRAATELERAAKTSGGVLNIRKAGGGVNLVSAPDGARIHTGGGNVRVGRGAGLVDARTGGGDIDIGPIAGSVRAGTGAGEVRVTVVDARGEEQTVELSSGNGRIVVELPAGMDARFDLESAFTENYGRVTRIQSDWELERVTTTQWDDREGTPRRYVRARGISGRGRGLVHIRTVNGDIEVRRGR